MLYLVGLGLADERDITVKGLEVVKRAERVYLEAYTAVLLVDVQVLVRDHAFKCAEKLDMPVLTMLKVGSILWQAGHCCGS